MQNAHTYVSVSDQLKFICAPCWHLQSAFISTLVHCPDSVSSTFASVCGCKRAEELLRIIISWFMDGYLFLFLWLPPFATTRLARFASLTVCMCVNWIYCVAVTLSRSGGCSSLKLSAFEESLNKKNTQLMQDKTSTSCHSARIAANKSGACNFVKLLQTCDVNLSDVDCWLSDKHVLSLNSAHFVCRIRSRFYCTLALARSLSLLLRTSYLHSMCIWIYTLISHQLNTLRREAPFAPAFSCCRH